MKLPVLVLALVDDDQAPPPAVLVLYRFHATPGDTGDTGRHGLDVVTAARQSGSVSPLMTVVEVAGFLRVHPRTVERMVSDGRLRAVSVGRGYRFELSALAEYIASQEVGGHLPAGPAADREGQTLPVATTLTSRDSRRNGGT